MCMWTQNMLKIPYFYKLKYQYAQVHVIYKRGTLSCHQHLNTTTIDCLEKNLDLIHPCRGEGGGNNTKSLIVIRDVPKLTFFPPKLTLIHSTRI